MLQVIYSKNELQYQLIWSVRYDALDQSLTLRVNEPSVNDGEQKKVIIGRSNNINLVNTAFKVYSCNLQWGCITKSIRTREVNRLTT